MLLEFLILFFMAYIIDLEKGEIIERGSHQELINKQGQKPPSSFFTIKVNYDHCNQPDERHPQKQNTPNPGPETTTFSLQSGEAFLLAEYNFSDHPGIPL